MGVRWVLTNSIRGRPDRPAPLHGASQNDRNDSRRNGSGLPGHIEFHAEVVEAKIRYSDHHCNFAVNIPK